MNSLPWWQTLSKSEEIILKERILSNFYLKSDFVITNKRLILHYPNLILWMLPMWFNNSTLNLKQISAVNIDVSYNFKKIWLWVLAILIWLSNNNIVALVSFVLIWLFFFLLWTQVSLLVSNNWWKLYFPVVFWEKKKAKELVNILNKTLAENN